MTVVARLRARGKLTAMRLAVIAAGCLPVATEANATTLTLDLNSLATGAFSAPLTVDGFILTPSLGGSSVPSIVNVGGTNTLQSSANSAQGADTILSRVGGGTFTLNSLAVAALNGDSGHYLIGVVNPADSTGYLYGSYGCAHLSGSEACGGGLTSSFVTQNYGSTFLNVTSIDLDPVSGGDRDAIEAINVSYTPTAAPEPASLALVGLGLTALGAARRMRRRE